MRKLIVYLLFFVSYAPLFLYMGIVSLTVPKYLNTSQFLLDLMCNKGVIYFEISILSIVVFFLILRSVAKTAPYTLDIKDAQEKNVEYLSYIMTYFIAFLDLKFDTFQSAFGSLFLFCFIAFVYSKSNLIYSNPVLASFGYEIYEATNIESSQSIMIISKENIISGKNIPLIKLARNIYLKR